MRGVSIPIGFSSSLQLYDVRAVDDKLGGFNPYRVFKFVATVVPSPFGNLRIEKFQSLSGFQVRCNAPRSGRSARSSEVSIPIGFSSSLQRQVQELQRRHKDRFQSLSGFQVRCNATVQKRLRRR